MMAKEPAYEKLEQRVNELGFENYKFQIEMSHKRFLAKAMLVIGPPVIAFFGINDFMEGRYFVTSLEVLMLIVLTCLCFALYKSIQEKREYVVYRVCFTSFVILLGTIFIASIGMDGEFSKTQLLYIYPIMVFFLVGAKEGLLWVLLFYCGMAPLVLYTDFQSIAIEELKPRFLFSFFLVSLLAYLTEYLVHRNQERLFGAQREVRKSESLYREAYERLKDEIEERKRLEAQLIHSAKMASLGMMAGGIAHEIRNPLAVCSSAAQLLVENPEDRVLSEECADKIYSNVHRASRIIEDLLKFARGSGDDLGPVNLNEVLKATLSLIDRKITLQGIELSREIAEDVSLLVIGSSSLLQQVFLNIILNAANAMPEGGKLTISTLVNPEKKAAILFADTGCGIPREHLDNIFDPFFTSMPPGQGTGLGLSVSYGIIQQYGGSIEVESVVGAGTTFTVRLPLAKDEEATSPQSRGRI